jgi:uncharacterized repeat protein (TIGR04052 family)
MALWTPFTKTAALSIVAGALLLSGCGENDTATENAPSLRSVEIQFEAVVGDEALACSENNVTKRYAGVGSNSDTITLKDFRFFVSEVKLLKEDGTAVPLVLENNPYQYQHDNGDHVALLDFEDATGDCIDRGNSPATHTRVEGSVAAGSYTGIEFTLGVPFGLNHTEFPDVEALNHSSMAWNWAAGRKFTKLEAQPESNATLRWNFHLGSTGCLDTDSDGITDECAQPNRVRIVFEDFDPATNTVRLDYKALLAGNDLSTDLGGAKGCMSKLTDPECTEMFPHLGLSTDTGDGLCTNGNDCMAAGQDAFSTGVR